MERISIRRVIPFTDKTVLESENIHVRMVHTIPFLLLLSQNLMFFNSYTILASCMTSQIMTVNFPLFKGFFIWFSHRIASFMGASVIGHGIMARKIAP
jgi:hypothetical protein